jgi:signal transduction histidine kinase
LVWAVVGRALKPVDEMAKAAFSVSETDLSRRIVLPGTGDELDRLATTLDEMLGRVQEAIERERRFVADANNELRTPIAAARALLETALADPHSFATSRSEAVAQLDHPQQMVEDLLVLARSDQQSADGPSAGVVDLDELVLLQAH